MGKCDLCGEDAGMLRKRHKECEAKRNSGWARAVHVVAQAALVPSEATSLATRVREIAQQSFISPQEDKSILVQGWQKAVDDALQDDLLTAEEEGALLVTATSLSLAQDDLDGGGAWTRLVKAAVIRDILEDKLPQRMKVPVDLPFNFQRGETLVWLFAGATYYEERTRTHFEGGSHGVSIRVAKGLYYRVGSFKGHPVSTATMLNLGKGLLGITDKHLYFTGPGKSFRVKYDKIVSFTPYADGIGIMRDAQTARPQIFVTDDGWFTYNLITNLAKRRAA